MIADDSEDRTFRTRVREALEFASKQFTELTGHNPQNGKIGKRRPMTRRELSSFASIDPLDRLFADTKLDAKDPLAWALMLQAFGRIYYAKGGRPNTWRDLLSHLHIDFLTVRDTLPQKTGVEKICAHLCSEPPFRDRYFELKPATLKSKLKPLLALEKAESVRFHVKTYPDGSRDIFRLEDGVKTFGYAGGLLDQMVEMHSASRDRRKSSAG